MITFIYKVIRSFKYAGQGILSMMHERNMKVHILAAAFAIVLSNYLGLSQTEWFVILILISAVFAFEMINTAIEELSNIVRDELKLDYKATQRARDVAAGAVFVMAIIAALIGATIFIPKISALLMS